MDWFWLYQLTPCTCLQFPDHDPNKHTMAGGYWNSRVRRHSSYKNSCGCTISNPRLDTFFRSRYEPCNLHIVERVWNAVGILCNTSTWVGSLALPFSFSFSYGVFLNFIWQYYAHLLTRGRKIAQHRGWSHDWSDKKFKTRSDSAICEFVIFSFCHIIIF